MPVSTNIQRASAIARQGVAVAAIVVAALASVPLPGTVRPILAAFGSILLVVEHYLGDPSTGATTTTSALARTVARNTLAQNQALAQAAAADPSQQVPPASAPPAPGVAQ